MRIVFWSEASLVLQATNIRELNEGVLIGGPLAKATLKLVGAFLNPCVSILVTGSSYSKSNSSWDSGFSD